MKERDQKKIFCTVAGILLTAGLLSWMLPIVVSQAADTRQRRQMVQEMDEKETDYMAALRDVLTDSGYTNAGITMTKVMPGEGTIDYEIRLHHKRLCNASQEEKNELLAELESIPLKVPGSSLVFEII